MFCFTDFNTFSSDDRMRTFTLQKPEDMFIMLLNLPVAKIYLQKSPDLMGFFVTKPSHSDGLKIIHIWVENKTAMGALLVDALKRWAWTGSRLDILRGTCDFFGSGLDLDIYFWKKLDQGWIRIFVWFLQRNFPESDSRCHKWWCCCFLCYDFYIHKKSK